MDREHGRWQCSGLTNRECLLQRDEESKQQLEDRVRAFYDQEQGIIDSLDTQVQCMFPAFWAWSGACNLL